MFARRTDLNRSESRTMVTEETLLELDQRLDSSKIEVDAPLAPLTTFRIGGPADRLFHARSPDDLADSILVARDLGIPHFLLGRGANVLFGDRGFRGLVIRSEVGGTDFFDDGRVRAGAGVETHPDLIEATVSRGLGGLHHFVGIPSTVGGAMWQNLHFLSPGTGEVPHSLHRRGGRVRRDPLRGGRAAHRESGILPVRLRLQHPAREG